jgi:hypothetical protein
MSEEYYWKHPVPHYTGGWQLQAISLAPPVLRGNYTALWCCSHEGKYHATAIEALDCAQYEEFLNGVGRDSSHEVGDEREASSGDQAALV